MWHCGQAVYEESYWDGLPEEKQTQEANLFVQEERVEARGFQGTEIIPSMGTYQSSPGTLKQDSSR